MNDTLQGVRVIDLSSGSAGPIATMLLADHGAEVTRIVDPSHDGLRSPASVVWDRGKRRVAADLRHHEGRSQLLELLAEADVMIDAFAPGSLERLGLGADTLGGFPRLIHCSITGYGTEGPLRDRPAYDGLVQARTGIMFEQPGLREGPIFLWSPLPSYGAGLLAGCGVVAALLERELSGQGQAVGTSLLQGVLAWTTMPWTRVEQPTPGYYASYQYRDIPPTPCYEAADGNWIHPMPDGLPIVFETLGVKPADLAGAPQGSRDQRRAWWESLQQLYRRRPADDWLKLFAEHDLRCQPVLSIEESHVHPQILAIDASEARQTPAGPVRQFGRAVDVTSRPGRPPEGGRTRRPGAAPLEGIKVLDFGMAVAGPYGPMLLSDLGADVIRVDNVKPPRATDNQVWASCQRGKRSITVDLKSPEGRAVVDRMVRQADVIHHNMRPGVAERLGIGYEQARVVNPGIVYCHVTGFGAVGPLAGSPGSDQMSQALSGLEHEQGATGAGGHPTWNRLGVCDHAAAILSVLGVLEALYHRERTGESSLVESSICGAAAFLTSHVALGAEGARFPGLDIDQTGLGPLYRLYETADEWIFLAAVKPHHWPALCQTMGLDQLLGDPRFSDGPGRHAHHEVLVERLSGRFRERTATEWFEVLDQAGVPVEKATTEFMDTWFDEPSLIDRQWVTKYEHPAWGRTEQLGRLWEFAATPSRLAGPPVMHGQHSQEVLSELGYSSEEIDRLVESGITTLWRPPVAS